MPADSCLVVAFAGIQISDGLKLYGFQRLDWASFRIIDKKAPVVDACADSQRRLRRHDLLQASDGPWVYVDSHGDPFFDVCRIGVPVLFGMGPDSGRAKRLGVLVPAADHNFLLGSYFRYS